MRFKAERRGRLLREENDEHVYDGDLDDEKRKERQRKNVQHSLKYGVA